MPTFQQNNIYKHFLIYILFITVSIIVYTQISSLWTPIGGASFQLFHLEIPILIIFSTIFYFPGIKPKTITYIIYPLLILIFYISVDIFYSFQVRTPRPSDFGSVTTVFNFSAIIGSIILFSLLLVLLILLFLVKHLLTNYPFKRHYKIFIVKFCILALICCLFCSESSTQLYYDLFEVIPWSQRRTIKNNGRISSFVYYILEEKNNTKKLKKHLASSQIDVEKTLFPGEISTRRNIYYIVLESFIDVRLLHNIHFKKTPVFSGIRKYLIQNDSFSRTISPVYGGGTAQAEFELLTGVKSLRKIKSIEFNIMKGLRMTSLINSLKKNGYQTSAIIATEKGYYNSSQAYKSIGFDNLLFMKEILPFSKDSATIFDGDLFDFSRKKIEKHLEQNDRPIFSYILGMYGHLPYERDNKKRPDIVHIEGGGKKVQKISNQFYYRTREIAKYISFLLSRDPDCLIYITSDHLPPVISKDIPYKYDIHENISLMIDRGKTVDVTGKKYFEIPWLIWDLLSERKHIRDIDNQRMEKLYFTVLAESINKSG